MEHIDGRLEIKDLSQKGTFAGYGNVYNVVDEGNDIVATGAFTDSLVDLGSRKQMPALLWQHRSGSPIGAYQKVTEDKNGLYVEGMLALKTQQGMEAYELLKMNAISGLSIGFETKESFVDPKTQTRMITKADLWEVSLVTFPMNDQARIAQVKTIEQLEDLNGAERYLREVGGVSRSEAKALCSRILSLARREVETTTRDDALMAAFSRRLGKAA